MAFLIGAVLALVVGATATLSGLDRDRAFYPTVMIVIASCYALFAVMGGEKQALAASASPGDGHERSWRRVTLGSAPAS